MNTSSDMLTGAIIYEVNTASGMLELDNHASDKYFQGVLEWRDHI